MEKRFIDLFNSLYATLSSSQIERALRNAGMTHEDWMAFLEFMREKEKA